MTEERRGDGGDTRTAILDVAERLVQSRGFNGFSYADVAAELGITKAALHYHFPGKAELGESLVSRYAERFGEVLSDIDARGAPAPDKLVAYCAIYRRVLSDQRMCLCGMLAAEYDTLAPPMREAVERFFEQNETWLVALLEAGRAEGTLAFFDSAHAAAQMIIAALEGAMLVARPHGGTGVFDAVATRLTMDFVADRSR
jgi:TetR/AcrR family transcriptional repressor of nem operon